MELVKILFLTLVLGSTSAQASAELELLGLQVRNLYRLSEINFSQVQAFKTCYCHRFLNHPSCQHVDLKKTDAVFQSFNMQARKVSLAEACEKKLQDFEEGLRQSKEVARLNLSLAQFKLDRFQPIQMDLNFINTSYRQQSLGPMAHFDRIHREEPLNNTEVEKNLEEISDLWKSELTIFLDKLSATDLPLSLKKEDMIPFFSYNQAVPKVSASDQAKAFRLRDQFRIHFFGAVFKNFIEDAYRTYLKKTSFHSLLLLLKPQFNSSEIFEALLEVEKNALQRREISKKRIYEFESDTVLLNSSDLYKKYLKYVDEPLSLRYSMINMKERKLEAPLEKMISDLRSQELKKNIWYFAKSFGSIAACLIPLPQKLALSAVQASLIKTLCIGLVPSGYTVSEIVSNDEKLEELYLHFLSSFDGYNQTIKTEQIVEVMEMQRWNVFFLMIDGMFLGRTLLHFK